MDDDDPPPSDPVNASDAGFDAALASGFRTYVPIDLDDAAEGD